MAMRQSKRLAVLALTFTCALYSLAALAHSSVIEPKFHHTAQVDHSRAAMTSLAKADQATRSRISEAYGKLPLSFEINRGQVARDVRFLSRGSGYSLLLTPTQALISVPKNEDKKTDSEAVAFLQTGSEPAWATFALRLAGANSHPRIKGVDELPGKSNYLMG